MIQVIFINLEHNFRAMLDTQAFDTYNQTLLKDYEHFL